MNNLDDAPELTGEAARQLFTLLYHARSDLSELYLGSGRYPMLDAAQRAQLAERLRAAAFGILDAVGWPPGPDADVNQDILDAEDVYRLNDLASESSEELGIQ
jgi:hypothetical protein